MFLCFCLYISAFFSGNSILPLSLNKLWKQEMYLHKEDRDVIATHSGRGRHLSWKWTSLSKKKKKGKHSPSLVYAAGDFENLTTMESPSLAVWVSSSCCDKWSPTWRLRLRKHSFFHSDGGQKLRIRIPGLKTKARAEWPFLCSF